ncbi:HlyD family secretion protein [Cellvibrio japonicus]|uniref:Putative toxin secretion, membrane fusion protein n=1 Tax=Cellvibrio japonicus (strain Ueda107) TaxID=498211 RepID=B3PH10_CELJU|nr:HlyD family efflux transporter periplasmic adaptor subunit [Cellvibrio japonicus]ACE82728.1 putative toxin secretion, membrane fusion protein [Cellvibrio japonicus Ueda107]QEI13810.1 HlyD family efflux transporter periplasmic adaptor subunit [Cellvibrio japonicus]QEI17384.1 HlyD family efflux transporter periplasmic adaptor subunit [Cellvibrio japonicus]QEI20960.1 HlyD family efflux transporter periplasmic adaptor subunit [Cellvibrio japonicus]
MKLFRDEAIENQKGKVYGDIVLSAPKMYKYYIVVIVILLVVALFFLWLGKYNRKEIVSGYIDPVDGVIKVIADEPAVIDKILVSEGAQVKKGEPLIVFNRGKSTLSNKVVSDEIVTSLQKEIDLVDQLILAVNQKSDASILQTEEAIKSHYAAIKSLSLEQTIINDAIGLIERKKNRLLKLKKSGFVSEIDVENVDLEYVNLAMEIARVKREITNLENLISERRRALDVESQNWKVEILNLNQRKEGITKELINASVMNSYTVRSPIDGVIDNVFENAGRQIFPGAPVLTVRKAHAEMIARLIVPVKSSGLISTGQKVFLRMDAFPYQRYGVISGTIRRISTSPMTPGQLEMPITVGESFYVVDVELKNAQKKDGNAGLILKVGMTLKAEIIIERHSLLSYLLSPLKSVTKQYEVNPS